MGLIVGLTFPEKEDAETAEFTCPVCGKEYKTEKGLEKHMESEHGSENTAADEDPTEE